MSTQAQEGKVVITPTKYAHVMIRSDRGPSVDGTRLSLYAIMDEIKAGWPRDQIQDIYSLTGEQMDDVFAYIEENREEFEAEYERMVQRAEEERRYWEERNRERIAEIRKMPPPPGKEKIYEKLQQMKRELGME